MRSGPGQRVGLNEYPENCLAYSRGCPRDESMEPESGLLRSRIMRPPVAVLGGSGT